MSLRVLGYHCYPSPPSNRQGDTQCETSRSAPSIVTLTRTHPIATGLRFDCRQQKPENQNHSVWRTTM